MQQLERCRKSMPSCAPPSALRMCRAWSSWPQPKPVSSMKGFLAAGAFTRGR